VASADVAPSQAGVEGGCWLVLLNSESYSSYRSLFTKGRLSLPVCLTGRQGDKRFYNVNLVY